MNKGCRPYSAATAPPTSTPIAIPDTSVATIALPPPSEQLGDTLSARGRYLLAIKTYEALPPTATVENKLGVACLHMLMFDRARASFDAAIKLLSVIDSLPQHMGNALQLLAMTTLPQNPRCPNRPYGKAIHICAHFNLPKLAEQYMQGRAEFKVDLQDHITGAIPD